MELSELQEIRRQKADEFRRRGVNPYPPRTVRSHTTTQALEAYEEAAASDSLVDGTTGEPITVTGRMVGFRHMGKTVFAHVRDGYGQLQLYIRKDEIGEDAYADVLKL